jgi:hypothetical protein
LAKGRPSEKKGMKKIRLTNGNQHDPKPGASPVTNADAMEKGTVWVSAGIAGCRRLLIRMRIPFL